MSKIAVVTPCYNSRRFIGDAIASVRQQEGVDFQYIIVDDGSTDGTVGLVTELAGNDPRIKIIEQANAGTCAARNRGAALAAPDTQYLLFLDHDDALAPNALRVLSEYLDTHPKVCVAACQFQEVNVDGVPTGSRIRSRWVRSRIGIPRPLRANEYETPFVTFYCGTGQGPFAMFRRNVFDEVGGWTTEFWPHEDTDLFCKMALLGEVHYLPQRLYRKRVHADNGLNDAARLATAYHAFRAKWKNYQPRNPTEAAVVRDAEKFYYKSFRPFRHLRVGVKALGEFMRRPDRAKFRWAMQLFSDGVRELVRPEMPSR